MLVHLRQYRREDANENVRSEEGFEPDQSPEDYFDRDDVGPAEWERETHDGETVEQRGISLDGVAAVSVPEQPAEGDDPNLPGRTLQVRLAGGGQEFVPQAEIVEVTDDDP